MFEAWDTEVMVFTNIFGVVSIPRRSFNVNQSFERRKCSESYLQFARWHLCQPACACNILFRHTAQ